MSFIDIFNTSVVYVAEVSDVFIQSIPFGDLSHISLRYPTAFHGWDKNNTSKYPSQTPIRLSSSQIVLFRTYTVDTFRRYLPHILLRYVKAFQGFDKKKASRCPRQTSFRLEMSTVRCLLDVFMIFSLVGYKLTNIFTLHTVVINLSLIHI